ncbi:MAG: patatin-like phospholipase family protein [Bacteroidales bacterium]|nr:patatin-like phospholipase family protein [Bacteroidales bacterium]
MKKNIALVLSSGGARGFAHIGVINELQQQGFNITSIAGSSMGALVGGIYATGQLKQLEEWVTSLDIMEVLRLTDFSISSKGLVKGKKVIEKMKEIVPEVNIEDLSIPFCAVATDIVNDTEKTFTNGSLYDAIRASISIPTVFRPFRIADDFFVDGGVLNPVPVNRVKRETGDSLVVVNVNARIPYLKEATSKVVHLDNKYLQQIKLIQKKLSNTIPRNKKDDIGMFNLMNKSISLMLHQISTLTLEHNKPDLLINISRESFGAYDFYKAQDIIKAGEVAAQNALKSL